MDFANRYRDRRLFAGVRAALRVFDTDGPMSARDGKSTLLVGFVSSMVPLLDASAVGHGHGSHVRDSLYIDRRCLDMPLTESGCLAPVHIERSLG